MIEVGEGNSVRLLVASMDDVSVKLGAILSSKRWQIGNNIVTLLNLVLMRPRGPIAADRILRICFEYAIWKREVYSKHSTSSLPASEVRKVDQWLRDLDDAFRSLTRSHRWRVGSYVVDIANNLLLRSQKPTFIAHLEEVFDNYGRQCCRAAVKRAPLARLSLADLYFHLGFSYEKCKRWASAASAYDAAMRITPPRPGQYYRLGRVREGQRRWRQASEAYREAVSRNASKPHWYFRLGYACARDRKWAEAASAFESAIALDPAVPEWFYYLGQAREKTLSMVPQYLQHSGLQMRLQGDWPSAARAYTAAIELDSGQARYHFRLGHVLDKMRDFEGAANAFQKAVQLATDKPHWLYRLARAREQALDLEGALQTYQNLIAVDPGHTSAQARAYTIEVKLAKWPEASKTALALNEPAAETSTALSKYAIRQSQPLAVHRLRALLERTGCLGTEAEAKDAILECRAAAHLLPVDWWFALHWRLMTVGWFSLAYLTKDIAASLITSREAVLAEIGLTKYLEVAKALVQLGAKDEAVAHLQTVLDRAEDEESPIAAEKLIADIDAYCGDFARLESLMPLHHGVNMPEAEEVFRKLIWNKTIAVVGPAHNGLRNGAEIDSYDVIVRTNFLPSGVTAQGAAVKGTRTDVSYFNGVASKMLACEIHQAAENGNLKLAVLRPFNYSFDKQLIVRSGDLRYNPSESNVLLRARSFGVQRILHDILRYRPSRVKLFNIDFFISSGSYKKGYKAGELLADSDPYFLGSGHDYRSDFIFTRNLRERSLILGDAVVEGLLKLSPGGYLQALDQDSAPEAIMQQGAPT